ncbi:MAG: TlpA family protein disulfide reductase [Flavobacteriaceae bacterium]|nr:TlpA family protein disulfide reductase [Flavobacteriaceae bacterium]
MKTVTLLLLFVCSQSFLSNDINVVTPENLNGKKASNFTFNDQNGNPVSLSDFKGSYVYVDLWATWCGPCLYEIPHLQRVYNSMKDKNIVFVSISLDDLEDKDKWKKKVKGKDMGYQLFARDNDASNFLHELNVNYIPRFVLIDPEGNYVTTKAPAPSDARLKKLFKREGLLE